MPIQQRIEIKTRSPIGELIIDIDFWGGTSFSGVLNAKLTKLEELTIGNDNDSDIFLLPGDIGFEFHIPNISDSVALNILRELKLLECTVGILVANNYIWQGYIQPTTVRYSAEKKTYTAKAYDQTKKMLEIDPATNPLGYNIKNGAKRIIDLIKEPFMSSSIVKFPFITDIIYKSTIQARLNDNYIYSFNALYGANEDFYGPYCEYPNMANLLKSILLNYNLILFIHPDRKLYLQTRFAEYSINYRQISRNNLIEFPDFDIIPPIKGLKVKIFKGRRIGDNPDDPKAYSLKFIGNYVEGDNYCEEIRIEQPCGWYDENGAHSGLYVNYLGVITAIDTEHNIRYRKQDGTYSLWSYLWHIPVYRTWSVIKNPREKCTVKVYGNFNDWKPDKFYTLEGHGGVWRPSQFKFDLMKNTTEIRLRSI